uniref:phosphatidylinositol N-acetylglucosaminyltransferase n=1 Tax=Strigamia maritima TaxID=126957 RepID=T1ITC9_STRMM
MVSDYFYPNIGGVETYIFHLSQCLIKRGHKVIVITHSYGNHKCVRYLTNGLKVYYLPLLVVYKQTIFPTTGLIMRTIFIREEITIVHGHGAFSALADEAMIHASNLNIKTVFTDHSLIGFADSTSIIMNKLFELILVNDDAVICVSHIGKENTILRRKLRPELVYVIPNAVEASMFMPKDDVPGSTHQEIIIIVVSRLVYRKGVGLMVELIPQMCAKYREIKFIVVGNGPMEIDLKKMIDIYELVGNVSLLGEVQNKDIGRVLTEGQIFLNTSLTENCCIAIVEASCCGLQVVSTDVGGTPEFLSSTWEEDPGRLLWLAKPNVDDLMRVLKRPLAIFNVDVL